MINTTRVADVILNGDICINDQAQISDQISMKLIELKCLASTYLIGKRGKHVRLDSNLTYPFLIYPFSYTKGSFGRDIYI